MTPGNLTPPAEADLAGLLQRSLTFGPDVARRTGERLAAHFRRIESGEAVGHRHHTIGHPDHVRCIAQPPLVIFYDTTTRLVLRIVDGRRDLATVLPFA